MDWRDVLGGVEKWVNTIHEILKEFIKQQKTYSQKLEKSIVNIFE